MWSYDATKLPIFIPVNPEMFNPTMTDTRALLKHHQMYDGMAAGHRQDTFAYNVADLQRNPGMSMGVRSCAHLTSQCL